MVRKRVDQVPITEHAESPDDTRAVTRLAPGLSWMPSPWELRQILARHRGWRSGMAGFHLPEHDAYLEGAEGNYPDWRTEARRAGKKAMLGDAVLSEVRLSHAYLHSADLRGADLRDADLSGCDLSDADLSCTDRQRTNLLRTDLRGADLSAANLRGADLIGTKLAKAKLAHVDLAGTRYSPASEPPHPDVAGIRGLSSIEIPFGEEVGLVQLRKLLQDAGLRDLEREATYSIERSRTLRRLAALRRPEPSPPGPPGPKPPERWSEQARRIARGLPSAVPGAIRWLAFDFTTKYGWRPCRALILIASIWLLCVPVYALSMLQQPSGIAQIFPAVRTDKPCAEPKMVKDSIVCSYSATSGRQAVPMAAYFSLLSAVNIGFQDFTPGDWVQRLQSHEYTFRAEGWIRTVSGAQALLSVYLLAMWVLTQFGRPFQ